MSPPTRDRLPFALSRIFYHEIHLRRRQIRMPLTDGQFSSFLQSIYGFLSCVHALCEECASLCAARRDLYGSQNCPAYRSWCGIANIARYRLLSRTWHLCVGDAMSNQISRRQPHVLKKTQCGMDRNTHSSGDASLCAEPFEATLELKRADTLPCLSF
jgi:hypothetical protein